MRVVLRLHCTMASHHRRHCSPRTSNFTLKNICKFLCHLLTFMLITSCDFPCVLGVGVRRPRVKRGFGGDWTIRKLWYFFQSWYEASCCVYNSSLSRFILKDLFAGQCSSGKCRWNIIVVFLCYYNTISIKNNMLTLYADVYDNSFTMKSKKRES
jgi:hypothetical protein